MSQYFSQVQAIASRRQQIGVELEKLRTQISALEQETQELEIAARVLSRLGSFVENDEPRLPFVPEDNGEKTTVVQKIKNLVREFEVAGVKGVSSAQILEEMKKRYSISDPNVVRPTLWRMVKSNFLRKEDDLYYIVIHENLNESQA